MLVARNVESHGAIAGHVIGLPGPPRIHLNLLRRHRDQWNEPDHLVRCCLAFSMTLPGGRHMNGFTLNQPHLRNLDRADLTGWVIATLSWFLAAAVSILFMSL